MPNPDFKDFAAEQDSTGAINVNAAGDWAANDILVLYVATDGFTPSLSTANGYVLAQDALGNSASVSAGAGICGMFLFWKRAAGSKASGLDLQPVLAAPSGGGTVQACHTNVYDNCRTSGTPFHIIATAVVSTATTTINPPTITTTLNDCTVFSVAASEVDDSTFNSWGSTGAASPSGSLDSGWHSSLGNDCSWAGGRGGFATAGGPRNCTSTFGTSTRQAQITFALASLAELPVGAGAVTLADDTVSAAGVVQLVGAAAVTLADDTAAGASADVPLTGDAAITLGGDTATGAGVVLLEGAGAVTLVGDTAAGAAPTTGPDLGDHDFDFQPFPFSDRDALITLTTQASGSIVVLASGGNSADVTQTWTDNKGNTIRKLAAVQDYPDFSGYGTQVGVIDHPMTGGSSHAFTFPVQDEDENTSFAVEVVGGGRIKHLHVNDANAGAGTTLGIGPITTDGPAVLIALWWGSSPVNPPFSGSGGPGGGGIGTPFTAVPDSGFTVLDENMNNFESGEVQAACAAKVVEVAGSYSVTWTHSPAQGAQLWLVAVEPPLAGTGGITLADDAVAGAGTIALVGAAAVTLGDDVAAGAIADLQGAGAVTLGDDAVVGAGAVTLVGAAALALGDDAAAGSGTVLLQGVAAVDLAADAAAGEGAVLLVGTAGVSLADDAATGAGSVLLQGAGTTIVADDTVVGSSQLEGAGVIALGDDVGAGAGTLPIEGAATIALVADAVSGGGFAPLSGTGAATLVGDLAAGVGAGTEPDVPVSGDAIDILITNTEVAVKLLEATFRQNSTHRPLQGIAFNESARIDLLAEFPAGGVLRMVKGTTVIAGAVTFAAGGVWTYEWQPTDLAVPGVYAATITATDGEGKIETLPTATDMQITVLATL